MALYAHAKRCIYVLPGVLLLQYPQAPVVLEDRLLLWSPVNRKLSQCKSHGFIVSDEMQYI